MNEQSAFNKYAYILLFASLWGLLEATLGWLLHFLPFGLSGFVMFPIALAILVQAYRRLGDRRSLLIIGVIASLIKLVDLLLPGLPPIRTINPAVALLIEAAFAAAVVPSMLGRNAAGMLGHSAIMNFGWRASFLAFSYAMHLFTGFPVRIVATVQAAGSYLLLNGAVSTLISLAVVLLISVPSVTKWSGFKHPARFAVPVFAAAISLQYFL